MTDKTIADYAADIMSAAASPNVYFPLDPAIREQLDRIEAALVPQGGLTPDERLKNAAPELLVALTALRDVVKDHPALQGRKYVLLGIQVNDAISRATGGAS